MPFCGHCGTEIESFHQFCRGCGVALAVDEATVELNQPVSEGMAPLLPYQSSEETAGVIPAGRGLRFANLIVDYIIQFVIGLVMGIAIVVFWGEAGAQFIDSVNGLVYGIPIFLGYYIVLEALFGQTIGKLVTGTKVVNDLGGKASFGQILGRSFARLIPFEVFSFLGSTGRGWHDSLPKTYVIKCR